MPAKLITCKREYQPSSEEEEASPVAKRLSPETDEAEPVGPGRPYQAFVESEARKYWQDMVQPGSLAKPEQQELRAAARPILLRALRNRGDVRFLPPTVKAHMAVNAMLLHAAHRKELRRTYTGPYPVSDHIEALIQYMEDTRLAPRPIPLPWHKKPKHPPIYYYVDPITRQPTPREDALIRAEYVRRPWHGGDPVTKESHIHPSLDPHGKPPPEVLENELNVYYRLRDWHVRIGIDICIVLWRRGGAPDPIVFNGRLYKYKFTPYWLESYKDEYFEARRPPQVFVESEARKYWYEMVNIGSLAKPDAQELRGAARQPLSKERGWDKFLPPASETRRAVSAVHRRVDREIPLPAHGEPKHPPIYYYIDPTTRQPTPRDDALIRSGYVLDRRSSLLTHAYYIRPWPGGERSRPTREQLLQKGWYACYTLSFDRFQEPEIRFYWVPDRGWRFENASAKDFMQIQFYPFRPS